MRAFVEAGRVLIDPQGLTSGEIVGRAGSLEWVAARTAPGWLFVDWQAPLGEPITYRVAGLPETAPVTLDGPADEVASLDGHLRAPVDRAPARSREIARNRHEFWPAQGARPFTVQGGPARHSEPVAFGLTATATVTLEKILEQARLVVRHNRARCRVPACTVPPVRLFDTATATVDFAGYDHDGEYNDVTLEGVEPRPPFRPVAASTWDELAALHSTWDEVAATYSTWDDLRDFRAS